MLARGIQHDPSPPFIGLPSACLGSDSDLANSARRSLPIKNLLKKNDMLNLT